MRRRRSDNPRPRRRRPGAGRGGFFEIDILAGLVIVGALALALAAVLGRQHRAVQKLADARAATQLAESVLTDLQAGRGGERPAEDDVSVEVKPVGDAAAAAGARAGAWAEVVVRVRGARASLVGPVPRPVPAATTGGAP
jgi:type II secretory pathway pseudopilin PulG